MRIFADAIKFGSILFKIAIERMLCRRLNYVHLLQTCYSFRIVFFSSARRFRYQFFYC